MLAQWIQASDHSIAFSISIWKFTTGPQNSKGLCNIDKILIRFWELLMTLQKQTSILEKGYARELLHSKESEQLRWTLHKNLPDEIKALCHKCQGPEGTN